ncbi:4'-phosphopantetheinyl transferase family protein [Virgibacillus pantothenticus]|uniref:4'-phosphopantetheinyl transferase family protein n=1 Tax=Virgibacillus pantothenticus TaxID=1473 RepID=UPI0011156FEE|nr:4'-phosphopantetheinyl transferase superfamily protein [Virgibacillus pantothenticus]
MTEIEICAIPIPNANINSFDKLIRYLSKEKRARIMQFKKNDDKFRSLFAEILLRLMICKKIKCKNEQVNFEINSYGKPHLVGNSEVHFNISHSGKWVIISLANSQIGIDIEEIKEIDYLAISKRYFSDREYKDLSNISEHQQLRYFYNLWTLKESYVKNIGLGLSKPLYTFTITKINGIFSLLEKGDKISNIYQFWQWPIDTDKYVCSLCIKENKNIKINYNLYSQRKLIKELIQYF